MTTEGDIDRYKNLVSEMKDLNDFRNVAVALITAAKCRTDEKRVCPDPRHVDSTLEI